MKKLKTNSIIIFLCVLIAISSLGVGWTYSYFSATATAMGSVTAGHIYVSDVYGSSGNQLFFNVNKVVPNQTIQTPVKVDVTTNIDYYTRVYFALEVSNTGTHKAGCGDNSLDSIASLSILSSDFATYIENGVTYCYKLTPTLFDPSGVTTEEFDLKLHVKPWVGDGGCSYFMGANIKVNIFVEVVQANYLESSDKGGSYTESNLATLHSLFSLAIGQNSGGNGNENLYTSPYEIIEMGMFPQSLKANNVTVSSSPDANGYYLGSDGEKYVRYTLNLEESWNGYNRLEDFTSMKMNVSNDGRTMNDGETYYFKLEPIKWRVLKDENGTKQLVCNNVLQGMIYQPYYKYGDDGWCATDGEGNFLLDENGNKFYTNNYKGSNMRNWFNNDFYNNAFTEQEKNKIQLVEVDNSANSTNSASNPYACENTFDYVYTLSYQDLLNQDYNFIPSPDLPDINRLFTSTDFARATGAYTSTLESIIQDFADQGVTDEASVIMLLMYGYGLSEMEAKVFLSAATVSGFWWLRSPDSASSLTVSNAGLGGVGWYYADDGHYGVVPALQIRG